MKIEAEIKEIESDIYDGPLNGYDLYDIAHLTVYPVRMHKQIRARKKVLSRLADLETTLGVLQRKARGNKIFMESATIAQQTTGTVTHLEMTENLGDVVGDEQKTAMTGSSSFSGQGQKEALTIDRYFQRPVKIQTVTLDEAFESSWLRVWDLYTLVPSVRAKLRNYAYLRGDLHVRIAISGTPFHYGRLLLSYQPYDLANETIDAYIDSMSFDPGLRTNWLTYLSQAPGAVTIDVKSNKPVEVVCPFISTKPMHRLFNTGAAAIGAATSFEDLDDAGCLYIEVLSALGSVAPSFTSMTMTIYAWLENVDLGTLTGTNVAITTESGNANDEREAGPVEEASSAVLTLIPPLKKIPLIKKYARASEIFLTGLRDMSALFGWSKPVYHADISMVKNLGFQNGANVIGCDTNFRVTLDPKQELTVDPRVCGSDVDEMAFEHIYGRESYLISFDWDLADVPFSTKMFQAAITPCTSHTRAYGGRTYYQPTPVGQLSSFFQYWRGNIEYRFDFVCSSFHRGKALIYYEPNIAQNVLVDANFTPEKHFIKIIDLQETQSVSFRVNWAAPRPWLKTDYNTVVEAQPWGGGITLPTDNGVYNGYITVMPFTELTSPDGSSVHINVYVRGHDMHFQAPSNRYLPTTRRIIAESAFVSSEEVSILDLNDSTAKTDQISSEYFGEEVISLRSLLKRYCTIDLSNFTTTANSGGAYYDAPNIPLLRVSYSTTPVAYTMHSFMSTCRYMYLGLRGGMKWRTFPMMATTVPSNWTSTARVTLFDIGSSNTQTGQTEAVNNLPSDPMGTVTLKPTSNAGIEYEIPFYTNNAFVFSFSTDPYPAALAAGDMEELWCRKHRISWTDSNSSTTTYITRDFAIGEDFMFLRFQGCPFYSSA